MKPHYFYATTALALVVAGTTQAAGDHTQGTYICGKGLDDTDAATDTPTGTCKTVTPASGVQLPPMAGPVPSTLSVNLSDGTLVTLTGCSGQDVVYWECKGSFGAAGFCGAPINTSVPVIVVRAKLTQDASQKQFDFNAIDLTLVCGPAQSAPPLSCSLSLESGSTSADCISWKTPGQGRFYAPTAKPASQMLFNACVRMARGDYLGNGESTTRFGTPIQPYASSGTDKPACSSPGPCEGCFEASWDEKGAVCINHERWIDGTHDGIRSKIAKLHTKHSIDELEKHFSKKLKSTKDPSLNMDCRTNAATPATTFLLKNRSHIYSCVRGASGTTLIDETCSCIVPGYHDCANPTCG
jgi:hypothetical protein